MFQLHHLCNIGGSNVEGITRRLLKHCIANPLAMQCNFVGKGQTFVFRETRIKAILLGELFLQYCSLS